MLIQKEMPLLARHAGQWEGIYTTVDAEGKIIDQHKSLLTCVFSEDPQFPYKQTNLYTWDDGRTEEHYFPATYANKKIWFESERISGAAWEADEDTILLTWKRKDIGNSKLVEMIQLSSDGLRRSRTWHWFVDDKLVKRTLIEENKVVTK
ncbi:MAG: hypothetical protein RL189_2306 [Pseudomonadota bacterium]|jgi:hypothetical protein